MDNQLENTSGPDVVSETSSASESVVELDDLFEDPEDSKTPEDKKPEEPRKAPNRLALFDELSKEEYDNVVREKKQRTDPRKRDMYMYTVSEVERQLATKSEEEIEREFKEARKEAKKRIKQSERREKDEKRRSADRSRDRTEFLQSEDHRRAIEKKQRKRTEKIHARRAKEESAAKKRYQKSERKVSIDYSKRKQLEERKVAELKKQNTDPQKKRPLWKGFVEFLCYVAIVIALSFFIINFVAQKSVVVGDSMLPNLHNGDHLILEKVSYTFGDPERFDVIVFEVPSDAGKHYVKRVIGLPGETVQIIDGTIYINGEVLEENYGLEVMAYAGIASDPLTLGEGQYFVLGDNRNDSTDSRFERVGPVDESLILGHAVVRIWPLNSLSTVH